MNSKLISYNMSDCHTYPTPSLCSERSFTCKNSLDGRELMALIRNHSDYVRHQAINCTATVCCHCGLDVLGDQTPFVFHGTRPRRFLVLIGSYVCKVTALLARWRCPHCHRTFTDYPPFALAHKAYTSFQMMERAATYISNTTVSYRKGVCEANLPIFYKTSSTRVPPSLDHDTVHQNLTAMAHTTLFHWVTTLGGDEQQQTDDVLVDFVPATHKYNSEHRRIILITCRSMCSILLSNQIPGN